MVTAPLKPAAAMRICCCTLLQLSLKRGIGLLQDLTGGSQGYIAGVAVEERDAQLGFQLRDLLAQGGLCHIQVGGSLGKIQTLRQFHEVAHLLRVDIHKKPPALL